MPRQHSQSRIEIDAIAAMQRIGLHPVADPMGDAHHTHAPFAPQDEDVAELAYWLGGLFIDKECEPWRLHGESYFYNEMTSLDVWKRVGRALRLHGLKIVDANVAALPATAKKRK